MCVVGQKCEVGWAEPLPDGCPPADGQNTNSSTAMFRFVKADPPVANDFKSHRELGFFVPQTVTDCEARSVSLFATLEKCKEMRKLPRLRAMRIARLTLKREWGVVKHRGLHVDWWPCKKSEPLRHAVVVD